MCPTQATEDLGVPRLSYCPSPCGACALLSIPKRTLLRGRGPFNVVCTCRYLVFEHTEARTRTWSNVSLHTFVGVFLLSGHVCSLCSR